MTEQPKPNPLALLHVCTTCNGPKSAHTIFGRELQEPELWHKLTGSSAQPKALDLVSHERSTGEVCLIQASLVGRFLFQKDSKNLAGNLAVAMPIIIFMRTILIIDLQGVVRLESG